MGLFDKFKKINIYNNKENQGINDKDERVSKNNDENHLKEEMIECYDAYGRKMLISKIEWLKKVLPDQVQKHWNEPAELYNDILLAVTDGLSEYVVDAAKHLKEIDDMKERGYVILSIVYMKIDRNSDAQNVLEEYINSFSKTGTVLTNLAKTYEAQGKHQECLDALWEGLQLEPNQENGLAWWLAIRKEEGGTEAYIQALHEAGNIPGSYLPQLYLARDYIENKDLGTALKMYTQLIAKYRHKDEVLFMISGDMGQAGLVEEMLDLVAPLYDVNRNDERIAFNLLQGYLEKRNVQKGQKLISQLMQLNRPDIKQYLLGMSEKFEEIGDSVVKETIKDKSQIEMYGLHKPVWHYGLGDVKYLKTPDKNHATVKIGILVYTNSDGEKNGDSYSEKETTMGRLTRSIPLFISELFHYYTEYKSITFVPVIHGVGPVLSRSEWSDDMLAQIIQSSELTWMVTGNVSMVSDKFCITSKIINVLGNKTEYIHDTTDNMSMGVPLIEHVSKVLDRITGKQLNDLSNEVYCIPKAENILEYLNSLGQSLTQTLIVNAITPFENMYGERNIMNEYLMCCLNMPSIPQLPVIMASGFSKSKEYGSTIYSEFKEQALQLICDYEKQKEIYNEIAEIVRTL